jgi:predicted amidohydrolase
MRDKSKTFWFGIKVTACILAIPLVPILVITGCAYFVPSEPTHYYKIQRLNFNGEIIQTYYSKSYPWGTDFIDFKEYPSERWIKFKSPYTAEDLGTNKPSL